jgi:acyl-CoA synthetase (AMP-forming)/AMP-acid ligase II
MDATMNVGRRLSVVAASMPDAVAAVEPLDYDARGKRRYRQVSFRQLDDDSERIARGLHAIGVTPGTRLALLVRPGIDFISLVFGLFKSGAVAILIDPGMGRRNLIGCLAEVEPEGFIAIPVVQAVRWLLRRRFPKARFNVTVGRRWFWDGITLEQLRAVGSGQSAVGSGQSAVGGRQSAVGGRQSAVGSGQSAVGSGQSAVGSRQSAVGSRQWAVGSRQWAVGSGQSAVGSRQWAVGSGQSAVGSRQSAVDSLPPSALRPPPSSSPSASPDDPAAIIFTTGSTGPPKGVLYSHRNFDAQVDQIREFYGIQPGEIDLPCFPLFGLFNCAMGVTAVIPDMDPSRPAGVDPLKIIEAANDWQATQAFGSPAIWDRVGRYCESHGLRLPTIRRVLSAGAPIPAEVLRRTKACIHPEGEVHTPYGATESLPVASNSASEVLGETSGIPFGEADFPVSGADIPVCQTGEISPGRQEFLPHCDCLTGTAARTRQGGGVCVGRRFRDIRWKVIRIVDGPIRSIEEVEELSAGGGPAISCGAGVSPALAAGTAAPQIGELIVTGPQVTRAYVTRTQWNALSKIADGPAVWHRIGDSGYLDDRDRFWFCGRVAHRVLTADGPMYPICCEAIFNQHPAIRRSALVGVGPAGRQRPVIILEPHQGQMPKGPKQREALLAEIRQLAAANPLTARITDFLLHPHFPVDIRHNAKIFREKLAQWAERRGADRS